MSRLPDPIDRLLVAGTLAGAAGFALLPFALSALALLFLAAVAFALAAVHDRRRPPIPPEAPK